MVWRSVKRKKRKSQIKLGNWNYQNTPVYRLKKMNNKQRVTVKVNLSVLFLANLGELFCR